MKLINFSHSPKSWDDPALMPHYYLTGFNVEQGEKEFGLRFGSQNISNSNWQQIRKLEGFLLSYENIYLSNRWI